MECPRCRRTVDSKSRRCAWCGIDVLPGQHLLEDSGVVVRMPARESDSESEDDKEQPRLATLGDRFIALVLDSILVLTVSALVASWAFLKWGIVSGSEMKVTAASLLVGGSLSLLIAFVYVWVLEATFGSTLGKAIVGIGVVNNSERSSFAASAIRNLLRVVDGLGFYLIGMLVASCSKFRRRIGDICAGTYIVEGDLSEWVRWAAVFCWLAFLGSGAWALPRVCAKPRPTHAPAHFGRIVFEMGKTDRSIYFRVPRHGIDLAVVSGAPAQSPHSSPDDDSAKSSKLQSVDSMHVVP